MAIKVKHEGNVTSRIYAAAAGGKGKRQSEDAKVLLAAQQRGNGGGGGTGGGARAGGNAPTMAAPTSHAALGSTGQMLSPPSMSFNQRTQLQAQQDEAAMERLTSEQKWRSGEKELDRKHATTLKQSEIDNYNVQRELDREARRKEFEDERVWKAEQERKKLQQAASYQEYLDQGYSPKQSFELVRIDEDIAENEKNSLSTDPEKNNQMRADALNQLLEKKKAIIPHRKPAPDPNDPSQYIREVTLSDGRKVQMMRDARGNWTEYVPDRSKMTAQEIWDSAFVAPDGTRWIRDGKGRITPIQTTFSSSEKPDIQRVKYIISRIAELTDQTSENNAKIIKEGGKLPTREEAAQIALDEYNKYSGVTPSSTSTPTGGGAVSPRSVLYMEEEVKRRGLLK